MDGHATHGDVPQAPHGAGGGRHGRRGGHIARFLCGDEMGDGNNMEPLPDPELLELLGSNSHLKSLKVKQHVVTVDSSSTAQITPPLPNPCPRHLGDDHLYPSAIWKDRH